MKMPFGKYRGERVEDLPSEYLQWLSENIDLWEPLRTAVHRALAAAKGERTVPLEEIRRTYRALALRWHPDRGGSNEAMAALNDFLEALTRPADPA